MAEFEDYLHTLHTEVLTEPSARMERLWVGVSLDHAATITYQGDEIDAATHVHIRDIELTEAIMAKYVPPMDGRQANSIETALDNYERALVIAGIGEHLAAEIALQQLQDTRNSIAVLFPELGGKSRA